MNLAAFFAQTYLFEYHEPPIYTALKWIVGIVVLTGLALALSAGFREAIKRAPKKTSSGNSPTTPQDQHPVAARITGSGACGDAGRAGTTASQPPSIIDPSRTVSDPDARSADPAASTGGSVAIERLRTLNHLREKGLVSAEVYEAKRQEILQAL